MQTAQYDWQAQKQRTYDSFRCSIRNHLRDTIHTLRAARRDAKTAAKRAAKLGLHVDAGECDSIIDELTSIIDNVDTLKRNA